jgi:hypothetical protein
VCVSVYPPIVARQRLGKNPSIVARRRLGRNVTEVTNTQATIEELLDASFFSVARVASKKVGDSFFRELFVFTSAGYQPVERRPGFPSLRQVVHQC